MNWNSLNHPAFRKVVRETTTTVADKFSCCCCLNFREKLDSELKACRAEKQSIELKLASFEILGKEFETLAEEYCRLRQEIEMQHWALKEFTQYSDK